MAAVLVVGSQLGSWHLNEGEVWGEQGGGSGCAGIWIQFQGASGQAIVQGRRFEYTMDLY